MGAGVAAAPGDGGVWVSCACCGRVVGAGVGFAGAGVGFEGFWDAAVGEGGVGVAVIETGKRFKVSRF